MTGGGHPPFLVVGHVNKVHGTKGELFVWPLTDYPGSHFTPGAVHIPAGEDGENPKYIFAEPRVGYRMGRPDAASS